MNRVIKLFYTTAIVRCPKSGLPLLQNGNIQADTGLKVLHLHGYTILCTYVLVRNAGNMQTRNFSSAYKRVRDEKALEEDAERKIGWVLKTFFAGTATVIGYHLFPYMGENVMQQSVKLLQVKDPLFKRMGASRIARLSIDDKRRMKIVELGGAKGLVNMLAGAKDDKTRKLALKALVAVSKSDGALDAIRKAGAILVIEATPDSGEFKEIEECKMNLMARLQDLKYDTSSY